jgi:Secretion system C-terminal sorting domain/Kelch motif
MKTITFLLLFWFFFFGKMNAQSWAIPLASLPEPVSNNAISSAKVGDTTFVYSFAGIDKTKIWSGIHLKSWRLNSKTDVWQPISSVPDPFGGKIAASASVVKNKIYVIGGYHVAANGSETSSNKTHIFDPVLNNWLADGANIPTPIDDQVQAVWRDSLIFVVTGWSNTTNVSAVQIYNPANNIWLTGTNTPNNTDFKAFGASGIIIKDTIFYCGGAKTGTNFPAVSVFRKGVINPQNPTEISWSSLVLPAAKGYRMAAATMNNRPIWLGGSEVTYNYDGVAYNGSGKVSPMNRIAIYNSAKNELGEIFDKFVPLMDLRGVAQIDYDKVIIVGGMDENAEVSDKVWAFGYAELVKITENQPENVLIYPNPTSDLVKIKAENVEKVEIFDAFGQKCAMLNFENSSEISLKNNPTGIYFLKITNTKNQIFTRMIVKM